MTTNAERIEIAEQAMRQRSIVISGHRYQPKLVWSLTPKTAFDLRALIEADGHSPLVYLDSMQLDRRAIKWAGAPIWAAYVYCVVCEIKATFGAQE